MRMQNRGRRDKNCRLLLLPPPRQHPRKVLEAMARERDLTILDAASGKGFRLDAYDAVDFASGVYFGHLHKCERKAARQEPSSGKASVFCVYLRLRAWQRLQCDAAQTVYPPGLHDVHGKAF